MLLDPIMPTRKGNCKNHIVRIIADTELTHDQMLHGAAGRGAS